MSEPKQIIVMRNDLNMRKGKMIAQGSHASLKVLLDNLSDWDWKARAEWLAGPFTKVCLKVSSEEELLEIYEEALVAGLHVTLITDAGRTEFNGVPTKTCIAIGPEFPERLAGITDHLKLL